MVVGSTGRPALSSETESIEPVPSFLNRRKGAEVALCDD
jgi:hypothetical protein